MTGGLAGGAALIFWLRIRGRLKAPAFPASIWWPTVLLFAYVAFQLIPLPVSLLNHLSPARAAAVEAANSVLPVPVSFAPLSVTPAAGLDRLIILATCVLFVFLVRELAWQYGSWALIGTAVIVALAEACLGMVQAYTLGYGEARGTWANRNHFANFEAMCLAFPIGYAISVWQRAVAGRKPQGSVLRIWSGFCAAAMLLAAIVQSLSRMGFTAAILSIAVLAAVLTAVNFREWQHTLHRKVLVVVSLLLCVLVCALALAPPELIARFGKVEFSDGIRSEDRLLLWKESLSLLSAYPVFGTGLGGYESAFLQHKVSFPLVRDAFAHNDYLQYLIELGALGFALAAVAAVAVLWRTAGVAARQHGEERSIAVACLGTFAALLLHSTVDFSLYIPANALLLAWITGIACSLTPANRFAEVIQTKARIIRPRTIHAGRAVLRGPARSRSEV